MAYLKNIGLIFSSITKGIFVEQKEIADVGPIFEDFFWVTELGSNIVTENGDKLIFTIPE